MSLNLQSDQLDAATVQTMTSNPVMQNWLLTLQEDLRRIAAENERLQNEIDALKP
jgi:hypothetical protein